MDLTALIDSPEAQARLEQAEAEFKEQPDFMREQVDSPEQQPTPEAVTPVKESPDSLPTDTPATAEVKPTATDKKVEDQKPEKGSAFTKDAIRRDTSWKALNTQKEEFKKQQEAFAAQQQAFQKEQESFKVEQAKKSQPLSPEKYLEGAQTFTAQADNLDLQADGLEKRAEKFEEDGKYSEAEQAKSQARQLRHKAIVNRGKAEDAKEMAEHLKKNPEPTLAEIAQKKQQALQHFTLEAAKKFPELAKDGSDFQKQQIAAENRLKANGYDVSEHPLLRYHVAEFVAANAAAARVPGMEKQLGELQAKVKELEALNTPSNGGSSTRLPSGRPAPLSLEAEEEELREMAMNMR